MKEKVANCQRISFQLHVKETVKKSSAGFSLRREWCRNRQTAAGSTAASDQRTAASFN